MTPLEQFNEEVMKEFEILMHGIEVADTKEPAYVDKRFISDFITKKLTEHKELILKMVREKFPNTERGFLDEEIDPWQRGFNACLDQIKDELESL